MRKYFFIIIGLSVIITGSLLLFSVRATKRTPHKESTNNTPFLESQTNHDGSVSIAVSSGELSGDIWRFIISLDTHSEELDADLASITMLIDEQGNEYRPMNWVGDLPGGHHRSGILRFQAIRPLPSSIILRIHDIGGVPKRDFWWPLE